MFLYEMHCHTAEGSRCASLSGSELAHLYAEKGYQGVIVTDHFYGGNTAIDRKKPWSKWVDGFLKGYENAQKEGKRMGLQVFLGWEYNDRGTEILTYGLDGEWLKNHPELTNINAEKYCDIIRNAGGITIHAHPFRQRHYVKTIRLMPGLTDGVEAVNKCNEPKENYLADQYADNFGLMKIGGTDFHNLGHASVLGGIAMPFAVTDVREIFEAARAEKLRIL